MSNLSMVLAVVGVIKIFTYIILLVIQLSGGDANPDQLDLIIGLLFIVISNQTINEEKDE